MTEYLRFIYLLFFARMAKTLSKTAVPYPAATDCPLALMHSKLQAGAEPLPGLIAVSRGPRQAVSGGGAGRGQGQCRSVSQARTPSYFVTGPASPPWRSHFARANSALPYN